MPLDAGGGDGAWEFVLMFVSTLIEEVYFVGGSDGNGGVDGYIWDCNTDDPLVVSFEIFDLCFWKETHKNNDLKFKPITFKLFDDQ